MTDNKTRLYFIAIVPPSGLQEEVTGIKEYFADHYNARHALKSPPHITLHMPFRWKETREEELCKCLEALAKNQPPVEIFLHGFGAFPRRVIYIHVEGNPALSRLYQSLTQQIRRELGIIKDSYKNQGFTAHMTVAHRDLKPAAFDAAWREFEKKPFRRSFSADHVALLRHNGQRWHIHRSFSFGISNMG